MSEPLEHFAELETITPRRPPRRAAAAQPASAPAPAVAAVDALLAHVDAVTQRATAAAGGGGELSALLAERDALVAELARLLREAAGGAALPDAVAAAVERQLAAIVERNIALRTVVSDARAQVIAEMHALRGGADGAAAGV